MTQVTAGQAARPLAIVVALGTAQTVAWASSYYLPAILAAPISLPSRVTGALAPLALGLMVEHIGSSALWISALASISAFSALLLLRADRAT